MSKAELLAAPRHEGELQLDDWAEQNTFGRPIRRARLLKEAYNAKVHVISPLFEPQLIKVRAGKMTLLGHEIEAGKDLVRHVLQVWLVRPLSSNRQNPGDNFRG